MTPRQKTEALALAPFKAVLDGLGLPHFTGQLAPNRLLIQPNVYFQFGDLRVELPTHTVVVEVESAGGVTNLAKYWEAVVTGRVSKPVKLLHVFLRKSENDYEAHMIIWRFLATQMERSLSSRWEARCVSARSASAEGLAPALEVFRGWLEHGAA